jgi:hypothetical protein
MLGRMSTKRGSKEGKGKALMTYAQGARLSPTPAHAATAPQPCPALTPSRRASGWQPLALRPQQSSEPSDGTYMDEKQLMQAKAQLTEHASTAYETAKTLLRTSHVINQYVSLAAGGLVCFSAVVAFLEVLVGWTERPLLNTIFGVLTQGYFFVFGAVIIILEVPIVERTKPVCTLTPARAPV